MLEWIMVFVHRPIVLAPLQEIAKFYAGDYPETWSDDYIFSSKSDDKDPVDMNDLLLPEIIIHDYLVMRIMLVSLNQTFSTDILAPHTVVMHACRTGR